MEFFQKILKKFKNLLLCGRKRPRSDFSKMEDENLFFSIKKRRLSEPKFYSKKINLKENSLNIEGKKTLSQFEIKEKMRIKNSQANVVFANDYLKVKIKKLKKNIEKENFVQTETPNKKSFEEIAENKKEVLKSSTEVQFMGKFNFISIPIVDLESNDIIRENSNDKIQIMEENEKQNALEQDELAECESLNSSSDRNDPSIIEITNSIKENDSEHVINIENKFIITRTYMENNEEDEENSNSINPSNTLEDYNQLIENISTKTDQNNFPKIEYSQFHHLNG